MLGEGPFSASQHPEDSLVTKWWKSRVEVVTVMDHSWWGQSASRQLLVSLGDTKVSHLWQCPLCRTRLGLHGKEQSQIAPRAAASLGMTVVPPSDTLPASKYFQPDDFPSCMWLLISQLSLINSTSINSSCLSLNGVVGPVMSCDTSCTCLMSFR